MSTRRLLHASAETLGESPLWPSAALVTSAFLYADLPTRFIAGPSSGAFAVVRWLVPGLTVVVLAALLASVPGGRLPRALDLHGHRLHLTRRWLLLGMIATVSAANAASIILLVHLLVNGAHANAMAVARAVNILR